MDTFTIQTSYMHMDYIYSLWLFSRGAASKGGGRAIFRVNTRCALTIYLFVYHPAVRTHVHRHLLFSYSLNLSITMTLYLCNVIIIITVSPDDHFNPIDSAKANLRD